MAPRKVILGLEANHLEIGRSGGDGGAKVAGKEEAGGRHDCDCYKETAERHKKVSTNSSILLVTVVIIMESPIISPTIVAFSFRPAYLFATYSYAVRTSDPPRAFCAPSICLESVPKRRNFGETHQGKSGNQGGLRALAHKPNPQIKIKIKHKAQK